jgi:hypothetical protein
VPWDRSTKANADSTSGIKTATFSSKDKDCDGAQEKAPSPGPDRAEPIAGAGNSGARARPGPPNLVYAENGHESKTVMSARTRVREGKVLVADEAAIRAEAQVQAEEIARCVAADPVHKGMALLEAIKAGQL